MFKILIKRNMSRKMVSKFVRMPRGKQQFGHVQGGLMAEAIGRCDGMQKAKAAVVTYAQWLRF